MKHIHLKHWLVILGLGLALLSTGAIATFAAQPQQKPTCLADPKYAGAIYIGCKGLNPSAHYFFQTTKVCPPQTMLEENGGLLLTNRTKKGWQLDIQPDGTWTGTIGNCSNSTYRLFTPGSPPIPVGYSKWQH